MDASLPAGKQQRVGPQGAILATPSTQFQLLRYFSVTSLVGVLVVLATLVYFYRHFAIEALEQHKNQDNVVITHLFASTIWPKHATYFKGASGLSKAQLQSNHEVASIREDVLRQMAGLFVVKVKVYDLQGITIFSTDAKQIGEDDSKDDGFIAAKAGNVVSEIVFKNHFDSFEKVINDRNLISTYIPIRANDQQPPEGVFEVYSDVTDYVGDLERATWEIAAIVMGSLALLYAFLFAIVRRADQTIRAQSAAVDEAYGAMLTHQSLHDPLTGLPNRASLSERLDSLLRSMHFAGKKCAVLCLGLDGFKEINDSFGHVVGDDILKEVARRLMDQFRDADITARVGGDEFVVAISEVTSSLEIDGIVQVAERIQRVISAQSILVDGHDLAITASIGVAIYPDDGKDVVDLLQSADAALSHAKKMGRNGYQFHTPDMNDRALEMLLMEHELRRALDEHQFLLYYQPQMDLASMRIIGAEALIRWQHPVRGLVAPAQFIPVAEERGLIVPLGEWVMREACRQNREWQQAGMAPIPVAINLSALHFNQKSLLQDVVRVLHDADLPPACLELELTESSLLRDAATTIQTMNQLKEAGVMLALDDFGTGYSSLSQLKSLPLDNLKLDQSFVRGLPDDGDDLAICSAVIAMGKALGLKVIAEGVETPEQLAVLRSLGCDHVQGYLLARPMPAAQFLAFFRTYVPG